MRRLSALDSEVLKIDDRILAVEESVAHSSKDMSVMREILIDQILTTALLELAIAAIVISLLFFYWKDTHHVS